jgi:hypothetical protein
MGGSPVVSPPPAPVAAYGTPVEEAAPVSPPPPKEIDIRTMASDQESLKTSGGLGPTPVTVIPAVSADGKRMDSVGVPRKRPSGNKKALLMGLGIIVILGAAAAVAVFFVLPRFFNNTPDTNDEIATTSETTGETGSASDGITPTVPAFVHESFFSGPTNSEVEIELDEMGLSAIRSALTSAATNAITLDNTLTEFYVTTGGGASQPVVADEFLGAILPDLALATPLEEDFTGFLYNDGTNVWPGYIFALDKLADDKDLLKSILGKDLEGSGSLSGFFLNDPSAPTATAFKSGAVTGELTGIRYLPYTASGASLNYGWKGDRLVISTSYAGLKAVASIIGGTVTAEPPAAEPDTGEVPMDTGDEGAI